MCISLIKQALIETTRRVKLLYVNQNAASIIYRETLDRLQTRFADSFVCQHWLDDAKGLVKAEDIATAAGGWETADTYICGPGPLMDMAEETLSDVFGPSATILTERFVSPDDASADQAATEQPVASEGMGIESFRLTLDGAEHVVPIVGDQTLLQAALVAGIDAPNSCVKGIAEPVWLCCARAASRWHPRRRYRSAIFNAVAFWPANRDRRLPTRYGSISTCNLGSLSNSNASRDDWSSLSRDSRVQERRANWSISS